MTTHSKPSLAVRFLGVGNSHNLEHGNSSAVLERAGAPVLLIDCGFTVPCAFQSAYGFLPEAVYITHCHLDHIGGLENLFYSSLLSRGPARIRLYAPAHIIPLLHQRVGCHPSFLAEGGANFWDAFQLIPVTSGFWHEGLYFDVFESRHHAPQSAYGLRLPGRFLYTGDTRPIPHTLNRLADSSEVIFHDVCLRGNPSHAGLDDIEGEYDARHRSRMVLYHFDCEEVIEASVKQGLAVARPGVPFPV